MQYRVHVQEALLGMCDVAIVAHLGSPAIVRRVLLSAHSESRTGAHLRECAGSLFAGFERVCRAVARERPAPLRQTPTGCPLDFTLTGARVMSGMLAADEAEHTH